MLPPWSFIKPVLTLNSDFWAPAVAWMLLCLPRGFPEARAVTQMFRVRKTRELLAPRRGSGRRKGSPPELEEGFVGLSVPGSLGDPQLLSHRLCPLERTRLAPVPTCLTRASPVATSSGEPTPFKTDPVRPAALSGPSTHFLEKLPAPLCPDIGTAEMAPSLLARNGGVLPASP